MLEAAASKKIVKKWAYQIRILGCACPFFSLLLLNSVIVFAPCFCLITSLLSPFPLSLVVPLRGRNNLAAIANKGKFS